MARLAYALPLTMLTVGCKPAVPPAQPDTATRTETAEVPAKSAIPPTSDAPSAGVTMRYSCDPNHRVEIVGGDTARITLADGRIVDIPRVADSAPPRYAGIALSFEVGSEGAMLDQDEAGGFACREAD
jgi:hypothetical protein